MFQNLRLVFQHFLKIDSGFSNSMVTEGLGNLNECFIVCHSTIGHQVQGEVALLLQEVTRTSCDSSAEREGDRKRKTLMKELDTPI